MHQLTKNPLSFYSDKWIFLPQKMVANPAVPKVSSTPSGMIEIPAKSWSFIVTGNEIEGGDMDGVDVQYPWESVPRRSLFFSCFSLNLSLRHHTSTVSINGFYIDKYPVTNAQYKAYLDKSNYHPSDPTNFLKVSRSLLHLSSFLGLEEWHFSLGLGKETRFVSILALFFFFTSFFLVTWVSIEEARQFCQSRNPKARLPNEWEVMKQ